MLSKPEPSNTDVVDSSAGSVACAPSSKFSARRVHAVPGRLLGCQNRQGIRAPSVNRQQPGRRTPRESSSMSSTASRAHALVKAWPAAARIELRPCLEELVIACAATVESVAFFVQEFASSGAFGGCASQYRILLRAEFFAPLFLGFLDFVIHIFQFTPRPRISTPDHLLARLA